jgi:hypothetical protein
MSEPVRTIITIEKISNGYLITVPIMFPKPLPPFRKAVATFAEVESKMKEMFGEE